MAAQNIRLDALVAIGGEGTMKIKPERQVPAPPDIDISLDGSRLAGIFARVTFHIPDKGRVTIRCFCLYANAHRGKVGKSREGHHKFLIIEEECPRIPRCGWAEIR